MELRYNFFFFKKGPTPECLQESAGVISEMERKVYFLDGFINKEKCRCVLYVKK